MRRPRPCVVLLALAGGLLLALWLSVASGPVHIAWNQTLAIVLHRPDGATPAQRLIVNRIRLPRALSAVLVGWILAVSGMTMQGLFQNALASPYLLGIASGASAGAAAVIALDLQRTLGGWALPLSAFVGGSLAVLLAQRLAQLRAGARPSHTLILAGIALGALFSSATTFLIVISGERLREIVFWTMGNLGRLRWSELAWLGPLTLLGTSVLALYMRELNALALGEASAVHLGLNPKRLRWLLLFVTTLLTSAAVALAGTIGFVGLITPHALRLVLGPDQRLLLPASALGGALFLLLSDTLARTALAPLELPVGVLSALVGAPVFLLLLLGRDER